MPNDSWDIHRGGVSSPIKRARVQPLSVLRENCQRFYQKYKPFIESIILSGSLAKEGHITKVHDIDLVVITRLYYNPLIYYLLAQNLRKYFDCYIDIGRYYLSRLKNEKSLYLYHLKYTSQIIAGRDVRHIINVSITDLYPCEAIRLLLNSVVIFVLEKDQNAMTKVLKRCGDVYLLRGRIYSAWEYERLKTLNKIYPGLIHNLARIKELDILQSQRIVRQEILELFQTIQKELKISPIEYLRKRYHYLFIHRLYTCIKLKNAEYFLKNPIFDSYKWAMRMLLLDDTTNPQETRFHRKIVENAPQPIIS